MLPETSWMSAERYVGAVDVIRLVCQTCSLELHSSLYGRRLFVRIVSTSALWAVDLGRPSSGGLFWRWPTSVTDSVNESASPRVAYMPIQSISLTDRRHTWLVNRAVTVSKPNHLIYSVYSIHARAPVLCSAQSNTLNSHCILSGEFCVTSDPLAYVT